MNIAEKSMEKTKFYNREDLKAKDVVRLIGIWEGEVDATKEWLKKNEIPSDAMFFRPVGDYSPGPDCKRRIYEENIKGKYNVQFVLDDSSKCVKMWREQGLICLQPNEGKF